MAKSEPDPQTTSDEEAAAQSEEKKATRRTAKKDEGEDEERVYTHERLIAESQKFLGVPSHVTAGALTLVKGNPLTLTQARSAVDKFSRHEG